MRHCTECLCSSLLQWVSQPFVFKEITFEVSSVIADAAPERLFSGMGPDVVLHITPAWCEVRAQPTPVDDLSASVVGVVQSFRVSLSQLTSWLVSRPNKRFLEVQAGLYQCSRVPGGVASANTGLHTNNSFPATGKVQRLATPRAR